jgi:predicted DNA-binding transcriptional regulator YafY
MLAPASRLLELLELLQGSPKTTGSELAARLGLPIEGQRGVGGGYRLRPGFRLPPLMLDDGEAVAVVLGLVAARQLTPATTQDSIDSALAKINRVLPDLLRRRAEALEQTLAFTKSRRPDVSVNGDIVLLLADATRRRRRLRFRYRVHSGDSSSRRVSPYGLVVHSGLWYLPAFDHAREDLRTFRVDRMSHVTTLAESAAEPPDDFDAVAHVSRSLARVPWRWDVEVLLDLTVDRAAARIPATLGELFDTPDGTLLRMRVSSLDWMASILAGLDCPFTIHRPPELRESVRALASRLVASA